MPKKNLILLVLVLTSIFLVYSPLLAAEIGYVDFEYLFIAHPEYSIKSQEYQSIIEKYIQEYEEAAKEITEQEELNELITYYDAKVIAADEELSGFIIDSLKTYVEKVAQENSISLVLAKNMVIYGGIDLTELVIEEMYRSYGISVPSYLRLE